MLYPIGCQINVSFPHWKVLICYCEIGLSVPFFDLECKWFTNLNWYNCSYSNLKNEALEPTGVLVQKNIHPVYIQILCSCSCCTTGFFFNAFLVFFLYKDSPFLPAIAARVTTSRTTDQLSLNHHLQRFLKGYFLIIFITILTFARPPWFSSWASIEFQEYAIIRIYPIILSWLYLPEFLQGIHMMRTISY